MKLKLAQRMSRKPMWRPPAGWFAAAHLERDAAQIFKSLVEDNETRRLRGLPTYEPSLELARKILEVQS